MVTLVPGGPSFGEMPVTTGLLAIGKNRMELASDKSIRTPF